MTTWETPARCGLASRRVAAPHARAAGRTRGSKGQELKAASICSKATTLKPGFTAFAPGSNLTLRLPLYAFADRAVTDPRGAGLAGGGTPHGGTTSSMPLECHGGTLNRCTELCPADPPIAFTKCASICGSHCSPFRAMDRLPATIQVSFMTSYEGFGTASIFCVRGCTCGTEAATGAGMDIDGHRGPETAERFVSVHLISISISLATCPIPARPYLSHSRLQPCCDKVWTTKEMQAQLHAPTCELLVHVLQRTRSGRHKVKLGGVNVLWPTSTHPSSESALPCSRSRGRRTRL